MWLLKILNYICVLHFTSIGHCCCWHVYDNWIFWRLRNVCVDLGWGEGCTHTVTISYLVTCWLRSAPICSCQRSKQAQPLPAAKCTGDCWQGSGGALTEAPASSRSFKLSTCGKTTAPASLLPLSCPTRAWGWKPSNSTSLTQQHPVVSPLSPVLALPRRQTSGSLSL